MIITLMILFGLLAGFILWGITIYNRLVIYQSYYRNALAQIEVQLKRRYDLIPNLLEATKGYLQHEKETLSRVTEARNQAAHLLQQAMSGVQGSQLAELLPRLGVAEQTLRGAMQQFTLQVEAYPELKANQSIAALFEELASTENRIAFARQGYNDAATTYNAYRMQFPFSVIAMRYGHTRDIPLLEIDNPAQYHQTPQIQF